MLFGETGFDRTTVRAVAARTAIHPSLVMRYYGSKEGLFAAAVTFDLRLPDLSETPRRKRGVFLAAYLLERWEGPDAGDELPALLRVAVTHPDGRRQMGRIFKEQLEPAIAKVVPKKRAVWCAALIATQAIGLAFTRYVVQLPPVVAMPADEIVRSIGAVFQLHLDS